MAVIYITLYEIPLTRPPSFVCHAGNARSCWTANKNLGNLEISFQPKAKFVLSNHFNLLILDKIDVVKQLPSFRYFSIKKESDSKTFMSARTQSTLILVIVTCTKKSRSRQRRSSWTRESMRIPHLCVRYDVNCNKQDEIGDYFFVCRQKSFNPIYFY